ncbi:hypothetical protein [Roseibium aggregatum]|uniref:Uncharacterized protein n=1 Tax=Roseibium aggregatum TaxID=187304 RepID=A0A926NX16_9HYPH|nr:hypothetical protein [Roseibium aggregatum]MBD1548937.1 hypothetical protein [Roseibium aggregatum]
MPDDNKKPGLKSSTRKPQLRSYGFLSHGGNPDPDDKNASKPARSRGMLSHGAVNERTPRELDPPKPRRPYRRKDT